MESHTFFEHAYNRALATIALALVVIALGAYAHLTLQEARYINTGPTTISVTGEGEVMAVPDIGEFSFAVRAEGEDATAAQEASAEAINEILAYLKEAGVAEKDVKTQNYNLNPRYRYEERACPPNSYCPPGERVIDGYEVSQSVTVKVRDTAAAGELISGVGDRGATNISSLRFTIDDEDALKAEAREKAIADAKEKARMLADDLDVRIVRMVGYWEDQGGYPEPYYARAEMAMDSAMGFGGEVAPSIPTGENSTISRVNITYEVK